VGLFAVAWFGTSRELLGRGGRQDEEEEEEEGHEEEELVEEEGEEKEEEEEEEPKRTRKSCVTSRETGINLENHRNA
jgi:hypothetical protein